MSRRSGFAHPGRHEFGDIPAHRSVGIEIRTQNFPDPLQLKKGFSQQGQFGWNIKSGLGGRSGYFHQGFAHVLAVQGLVPLFGNKFRRFFGELRLVEVIRSFADP